MKSMLVWVTLAFLAPGQVKPTQTTQDRNLIVGAWSGAGAWSLEP